MHEGGVGKPHAIGIKPHNCIALAIHTLVHIYRLFFRMGEGCKDLMANRRAQKVVMVIRIATVLYTPAHIT